MARRILGRGLESLIPKKSVQAAPDASFSRAASSAAGAVPAHKPVHAMPHVAVHTEPDSVGLDVVRKVPIGDVIPNPDQPRKHFSEEQLRELADSIQVHGILQPLVVADMDGKLILIAGERRLRASKLAGLTHVPVIVRALSGEASEQLELALIENVQRHDLNALEEAMAYQRLCDVFGHTQAEVARKVGKSRSAVANILRLLELPVEAQKALRDGLISEGHARAILAVPNREQQLLLLQEIIAKKLTVRETENLAKGTVVKTHNRGKTTTNEGYDDVRETLQTSLQAPVQIKPKGKGGRIVIEFFSQEELRRLYEFLTGKQ